MHISVLLDTSRVAGTDLGLLEHQFDELTERTTDLGER
jgi:hypothetical protein